MAKESINIHRELYKRVDIGTVIDTEFKTFTKPVEEVDTDTVEELFRLYDKLYFTIPIEGDTNSHQYLLKQSSELTSLDSFSDDIQPLLDEIAQLRQELLASDQRQFELDRNTVRTVNNPTQ